MKKTLYLECYSGISGDMTVAALVDLGVNPDKLDQILKSLPINGYEIKISKVKKASIEACDFAVCLDEHHENHDHDMKYLHSGSGLGEHEHHEHEHHEHEHHEHEHHEHEHHDHKHHEHHEHRGIKEIRALIEQSRLTNRAKETALHIFMKLAEAEARAHGVDVLDVHFHEVGAVDSIVDIVAVAVCLDELDIEEVIIPVLYEGGGMIRCQHGILPVPVPAVANLVEMNHLKLHMTGIQGEFVTPTGAAIAAAVRTSDRLPEQFTVERIGIGAGKRNYERPSLLRAMLIKTEETGVQTEETDVIFKLESNIDDCSGEALGYAMERLLEAGARDVHYFPVFMKKNRPAYQLNVLCKEEDIARLEEIIFRETTTIGIRRYSMERSILARRTIQIETSFGKAEVKVCNVAGESRYYPEYESVIRLCRETKKSYQEIWQMISGMCEQL